jgi:glyoxylase I family protein
VADTGAPNGAAATINTAASGNTAASSTAAPTHPASDGVNDQVGGERVPVVAAVPHIALTVGDTSASAAWWCRTFGFESAEPPAQPTSPARPRVVIRHPESGLVLGFKQRPEPARRGRFDYLSLRVASERALGDWAAHLHQLGIPHSSVRDTGDEQFLSLTAPDGIGLELWWSRPHDVANPASDGPARS